MNTYKMPFMPVTQVFFVLIFVYFIELLGAFMLSVLLCAVYAFRNFQMSHLGGH